VKDFGDWMVDLATPDGAPSEGRGPRHGEEHLSSE
jgi:hypothetical protein